jgi:hypothetical protein
LRTACVLDVDGFSHGCPCRDGPPIERGKALGAGAVRVTAQVDADCRIRGRSRRW